MCGARLRRAGITVPEESLGTDVGILWMHDMRGKK